MAVIDSFLRHTAAIKVDDTQSSKVTGLVKCYQRAYIVFHDAIAKND
ncbi:MAG: hypothetical protein MK132_04085 [Lentisphaerales bacterium]|nr:hypothetical protein [Lentisphaerales bacterium]